MSLTTGDNGHEPHYDLPEPNPDLGPGEVVQIVLDALQHNDEPGPDCGIRTTFNFASPANRASTGPLTRFAAMIKNSEYRIMIDFRKADTEPITVVGNHARQIVKITGADGSVETFAVELSRQTQTPYPECWMTDSVLHVE
jgi:hypothetical protein